MQYGVEEGGRSYKKQSQFNFVGILLGTCAVSGIFGNIGKQFTLAFEELDKKIVYRGNYNAFS